MNKTEFIKAVANKTGYTQKDVKAVIDCMREITFETLGKHEEVKMFDGVTFAVVHKDARTARNPQTGETFTTDPKWVPKFKAGKALKDAINA